jgi:hypothetical protein
MTHYSQHRDQTTSCEMGLCRIGDAKAVGGWSEEEGVARCPDAMHQDPVTAVRKFSCMWRSSGERAHNVQIIHFAFLEVTIASTRLVEGVEGGVPSVVRGEMSVV